MERNYPPRQRIKSKEEVEKETEEFYEAFAIFLRKYILYLIESLKNKGSL